MAVRPPRRVWKTVHTDSMSWQRFRSRPDDIVISCPPKSGTTWTQGIVASLLWPEDGPPDTIWELSPWLDLRTPPDREPIDGLVRQAHRRFVKTHSPADCLPLDEHGRYIVVYRDLRDVLVSWANHRRAMQPYVVESLNELAAVDGVAPLDPIWNGDLDTLLDELVSDFAPAGHLASWWSLRREPFVLFVHYADLVADLPGEMRRIADFLDLEIDPLQWPAVIGRCHIDHMRATNDRDGGMEAVFEGGAAAFFHRGTNGRGRRELAESQLTRIGAIVTMLPPDAAAWLEHGSLTLGRRP